MNRTRVTDRGQITIPKPLRDRLGIEPGTELEFDAEGGRLVGRKAEVRDPVDAMYGVIRMRGGTDAHLGRVRGDADAV